MEGPMNHRRVFRIAIMSLTAALLLPAAYAQQADARGVERSVTRSGSSGHARSVQHRAQADRRAGRVERHTTRTGSEGRRVETNLVRERTADGYTRSAVHTGPEGQTRTRDAVVRRTENGFTRDVVREGPKGTSTSHFAVDRDPEAGRITRSADHVLPDGRTASTRSERQKTENGSDLRIIRTGPNGKTLQTDVERRIDPETGVVTRTTTRAPGDAPAE